MPQTIAEAHSVDASYYGDEPDWWITGARHRDSDILSNANWKAIIERLEDEKIEYKISESGHWLVGWVEYLIIPQSKSNARFVDEIEEELEDSCILDEQLYSDLEQEHVEDIVEQSIQASLSGSDTDIQAEQIETLMYHDMREDDSLDPWYDGVENWWPDDEWLESIIERLEKGAICDNCGEWERVSGKYCTECLEKKGVKQWELKA